MNVVTLVIGEKYQNTKVKIDITSFHYFGMTLYSIKETELDSYISFVLEDIEKSDEIVETLRKQLKLNVEKEKYVKIRREFSEYEKDKRPRISVRLPSGYENLSSPPHFYFE